MLGTLDDIEETTFAAVGLALSRWEEMKISLADLYSIFCGYAYRSSQLARFCDVNRTFATRLRAAERASCAFFRRFPDQNHEGNFRTFAGEARRLARTRNLIAHGLVQSVNVVEWDDNGNSVGSYGYLLIAPYYSMRRLGAEPDEGFGSHEIEAMSRPFTELRDQATALLNKLLQDRSSP